MADAGIGEAAAAEGAKSAGEAAAAGAAEAGAAEAGAGALGAGAAEAGAGALGAEAAGGALGAGAGEAGLGTLAEGIAVDALPEAGGLTSAGLIGGGGLAADALPSLAGAGIGDIAGAGFGDIGSGSGLGYLNSVTGIGDPSPIGLTNFGSAPAGGLPSIAEGGAALPESPAMTGGESTISKALNALGSGALKYGPLVNSTLGLMHQGTGSAQKQLNAAAAPAQAVSNQLLAQFQSGQLTGSDQYAIAQWSQQQKAKIDQYYQSAGLAKSSMHQSALQQIDQQAEAMRQQAVQNLLKNGLSAAGVSSPLIQAGVNAAMKQDQEAQTAMSNFIATLAKMNTPAPTPTGIPGG